MHHFVQTEKEKETHTKINIVQTNKRNNCDISDWNHEEAEKQKNSFSDRLQIRL